MARRLSAVALLGLLLLSSTAWAQDWQSALRQGWDSYASGQYQQAIHEFDKSNRSKENLAAHKGLAFSYYELGLYGEAITHLRWAISYADDALDREQFNRRLAYSLLADGEQSEAKGILAGIGENNDIGIELWPQKDLGGYRISRCYRYSSALAAGLDTDDVLTQVGGTDLGSRNLREALDLLKKQRAGSRLKVVVYRDGRSMNKQISVGSTTELVNRISQWKNEAKSLYEKGNRQYGTQDYAGAIESYTKALELEDTFAPLYYNLAMAQIGAGDRTAAASNLEYYLELRPDASNAQETRSTLKSLGGAPAARKRSHVPDQIATTSPQPAQPAGRSKTAKVEAPPPAVPAPGISAPAPSSSRLLAVLPWRLVGTAENYTQLLSGDLSQAILTSRAFSSVLSAYDNQFGFSDRISPKELNEVRERIWPGTSSYSRSHSFNTAAATEIGRKLGAEAVLIGYWEVGGLGNDIYSLWLELHLIDVNTGKTISASDRTTISVYFGDFKPYMVAMVKKLIQQYKGER